MAKLIDILARELKVWPEPKTCLGGAIDYCCQSDHTTEVYFGGGRQPIILSERAENTAGVRVSRAEWQAAVDALNAPKVVEWDGEGMPPVGTVCDMSIGDPSNGEWIAGKVVVHIKLDRLVAVAHNGEDVFHGYAEDFRPIRTDEQIAAEQRATKINEALLTLPGEVRCKSVVEQAVGILIDSGYTRP